MLNPTVTQRALAVYEIVHLIVSCLDIGEPWVLLNLALTCHFFKDISLDQLWIEQRGLLSLLKTIPGIYQSTDKKWTLPQGIDISTLPSFNAYRRRIKRFCWPVGDVDEYSQSLLNQLVCLPGGLLPSLRKLTCFLAPPEEDDSLTNYCSLLPSIISPFCSTVSLNVDKKSASLGGSNRLWAIFPKYLSRIENLSIYAPKAEGEICDVIRGLPLKELYLRVEKLGTHTLCALSDSDDLRFLKITSEEMGTCDDRIIPPRDSARLQGLESLMFQGCLCCMTKVMGTMATTRLKVAELRFQHRRLDPDDEAQRREQHQQLSICLGRIHRSSRFLTKITLCFFFFPPPSPDLLENVFDLPFLTSFVSNLPFGINPEDTISRMTLGWPKIESLQFFGDITSSTHLPLLHHLQYFSKHCPALTDLEFLVSDAGPPADAVIAALLSRLKEANHGLRRLSLANSHIRRPWSTAAYLDAIFPRLLDLEIWDDDEIREGDEIGDDDEIWEDNGDDKIKTIIWRTIIDVCRPEREYERERLESARAE